MKGKPEKPNPRAASSIWYQTRTKASLIGVKFDSRKLHEVNYKAIGIRILRVFWKELNTIFWRFPGFFGSLGFDL